MERIQARFQTELNIKLSTEQIDQLQDEEEIVNDYGKLKNCLLNIDIRLVWVDEFLSCVSCNQLLENWD